MWQRIKDRLYATAQLAAVWIEIVMGDYYPFRKPENKKPK